MQDLINKVVANNPGANVVQTQLQWFSAWHKMLQWLVKNEIVGDKLWEMYKDTFKQDWDTMGRWIEKQIILEEIENRKKLKFNTSYPFGKFD